MLQNTNFLIILLFCVTGIQSQEQAPKTDFTRMYLPVWLEASAHCIAVAEAMPENLYGYKPNKESKSFAEQMVHIASASKLLTQRYVEGMGVKPNTPDANSLSKTEIIQLLKESFLYTTAVIRTIDQEKLDETCVMYHSGNTVSRAFALFYVQDHLTNHRAKANLYVRMQNIQPPEYTW